MLTSETRQLDYHHKGDLYSGVPRLEVSEMWQVFSLHVLLQEDEEQVRREALEKKLAEDKNKPKKKKKKLMWAKLTALKKKFL